MSHIAEAMCIARRCSPISVGLTPGAHLSLVKKHHSTVVRQAAGTEGRRRITESGYLCSNGCFGTLNLN